MKGSPDVIAALNAVYQLLLPTEAQAHQQEHQLEADGYKKISDWFHCVEEKGHRKLTHPLMDRIQALGGECEAAWSFPPDMARPVERLDEAVTSMIDRLNAVHAAYGAACEAAEEVDDYVTEKQVWEQLEWLECRIGKFEDRAAQLAELGVEGFLQEMFDKTP